MAEPPDDDPKDPPKPIPAAGAESAGTPEGEPKVPQPPAEPKLTAEARWLQELRASAARLAVKGEPRVFKLPARRNPVTDFIEWKAAPPRARRTPLSEEEALAALNARCPDTRVAGYWKTLEDNAKTWAGEINVQPFWREATEVVEKWGADYRAVTGEALFSAQALPQFTAKGLPRLREKTLAMISRVTQPGRTRAIEELFPEPKVPFPRLNDLVRVRIATRYLDGVEFVGNRLLELLRAHKLDAWIADLQQRDSGYYARHLYFDRRVLFRFTNEWMVDLTCEVQIATELSTTIWDRTHGAYELARVQPKRDLSWQWDSDDPRFLASQLSHMIHLADGIILRLRDRLKKGPKQ